MVIVPLTDDRQTKGQHQYMYISQSLYKSEAGGHCS